MDSDDVCDVCGASLDGWPTCGKCAGRELARIDEIGDPNAYHVTVDGFYEWD